MKPMQFRIGVAAMLCSMIVATLLLVSPATTMAAAKDKAQSQIVIAQGAFCAVTVQRGEALYMIAARYRTTTAYLAAINNLFNPNYIYAGMVLKVPCAPQPQPYPQPQPQPGICNIYIVQRGDWLKTIAWRFGVTWQAIAQVNGLYDPNRIFVGQRLLIPCSSVPPVCPGCPPCQGCPPIYPTPPPICPGCPPCQGCPPVYPTPPPPTAVPIYNNVEIHDGFYAPPVLTIGRGQYVQWINKSNNFHTVTQGLCPNGQCTPTPGGFNSGPRSPGAIFVYQFNQLGTFAYFDQVTGVGATIAVVP